MSEELNNHELENPKTGRPYTRRNALKFAACVAGLAALGGTGALAYFTGGDAKTNETTVAQNLNVKVVEEAWEGSLPETGSVTVLPGQEVAKDPKVQNLSDAIPGYLFAEVRIPRAEVAVADGTGHVGESAVQDLFSFTPNVSDGGWVLLEEFSDDTQHVVRYAWSQVVVPRAMTGTTLFDTVTFANITDGQASGDSLVTVVGYGIQAEPFAGYADAWEAYKKQNGIVDDDSDENLEDTVVFGNVVINANFIEVGESFNLAKAKNNTLQVVAETECTHAGTIAFADAPLGVNGSYHVMPNEDGMTIDESIKSFTVDETVLNILENANDIVYTASRYVFGVYSVDDNELRLYKRPNKPTVGDVFNGRTVSTVYDWAIETDNYGGANNSPWSDIANECISVIAVDKNIKPTFTGSWFKGFYALQSVNLTRMDFTDVQSMENMFGACTNLVTVKLPSVQNSVCKCTRNMFSGCTSLASLDLSSFELLNVWDCSEMFWNCTSLLSLDLRTMHISYDNNTISDMFYRCSSLVSVDLSSFNLVSTNANQMFRECSNLQAIYATNQLKLTRGSYIFYGCESLVGGAGTKYVKPNYGYQYACIDDPDSGNPGYFTYKAA